MLKDYIFKTQYFFHQNFMLDTIRVLFAICMLANLAQILA